MEILSYQMNLLHIIRFLQKYLAFPHKNNLYLREYVRLLVLLMMVTKILVWSGPQQQSGHLLPLPHHHQSDFLTSQTQTNVGTFDHFDPHFKLQFSNFNFCKQPHYCSSLGEWEWEL